MADIRPLYEKLVESVDEAQQRRGDFLALKLIREWCKATEPHVVRAVLMHCLLELAKKRREHHVPEE